MKTIKIFQGNDIAPFIDTIAQFRIEAFYSFPYLYVGDTEYEKEYLSVYTNTPKALLTLAFDHEKIVGISTGIPLKNSGLVEEKPGVNLDDYYYLGEVIILPAYQGQKLTSSMYEATIKIISGLGFKKISILTVYREANDPRMPKNYVSLDGLLSHIGFKRNPLLDTTLSWETRLSLTSNEHSKLNNYMQFWEKEIG